MIIMLFQPAPSDSSCLIDDITISGGKLTLGIYGNNGRLNTGPSCRKARTKWNGLEQFVIN